MSMTHFNGGHVSALEWIVKQVHNEDVVVWMPNVSNGAPKVVQEIKKSAPHALLVTSKRNDDGRYSLADITAHALRNRAALFLEIRRRSGRFIGRVVDPLGNMFAGFTDDFVTIGRVIRDRVAALLLFTRVRSKAQWPYLGDAISCSDRFLGEVHRAADAFHRLIPDVQTERFLGNVSFRCQQGFPSFKQGDIVFVSRRNVDKRGFGSCDFVPTLLGGDGSTEYYGRHKPSVDTGTQLRLYSAYPSVRFALHGHVYVEGAPFTNSVVACGALEEVGEVHDVVGDDDGKGFVVNLRGHGFLAMFPDDRTFAGLRYVARPKPEPVFDLPDFVTEELDRMSKVQFMTVAAGLAGKLGAYEKTGRVSYRYDLCPVCSQMGSTVEDDSACQKCYIHATCRLPFQQGFKESTTRSLEYWRAVQHYLGERTGR
jgi:hypothetical protein